MINPYNTTIMKKLFYSTLPAVAIALASWLLPTFSFATVEVDGLFYNLNNAKKTAVVAPGADKGILFVTIPETITCEGLTYTVTAIADTAFLDCHVLNSVEIKSHSLTRIGFSAFERCWNLANLVLVEGVETFNYEAFKDCDQLTFVTLPSTLKHIGGRSFMGCDNLTRINIPANVTYLGDKWVSGSPLEVLFAESETPLEIMEEVFEGLDKQSCILSVPVGSKEAYQNAEVWKDFLIIEDYDPGQGETTAIETIRESSASSSQIFDLQGRRLNNASRHSIVIENGRKRIQW